MDARERAQYQRMADELTAAAKKARRRQGERSFSFMAPPERGILGCFDLNGGRQAVGGLVGNYPGDPT